VEVALAGFIGVERGAKGCDYRESLLLLAWVNTAISRHDVHKEEL
jgi:hypothetical protein